ncbi:MAG: hypothetical protein CL872_02275 [Dehalococcoidaceae bacterium]|nr:hypothetical protein [Dehalococcoidaceae bacterium]
MRIFFIILFVITADVYAHQPKLINYSPSLDKPHKVFYPEISKAYYSELTGQPHYYIIESENDFLFYTSILSPKVDDDYTWFSLEVLDKNQNLIYKADGSKLDWTAWYEPYARDWYWKGPEIGIDTGKEFQGSFAISAGTYFIKVFNEKNIGHYSLAVGEAEFFGSNLWEQILTWTPIILYIGPYMDIFHWNKFDVRAFVPHIAIIVILFIFYFIIKKIIFRKKKTKFV